MSLNGARELSFAERGDDTRVSGGWDTESAHPPNKNIDKRIPAKRALFIAIPFLSEFVAALSTPLSFYLARFAGEAPFLVEGEIIDRSPFSFSQGALVV